MSEIETTTPESPITPPAEATTAEPAQGTEVQAEAGKPTTAPVAAQDKQTAKLLEVARREARLIREQREFDAKKAEYEKYEKFAKNFDDPKTAYAALKERNLSFDSFLDIHLNEIAGAKTPAEDPRDARLKRIEERWEEQERLKSEQAEQAQKDKYQQAWNAHITEVGQYISEANSKDPDQYVSILLDDKKAVTVYADIYRSAVSDLGRSLEPDEIKACIDRTEELLTDEYKPLFQKATKSKKFGFVDSTKIEPESKKTETPKVKTLTNSLTATAPTTPNQPDPSKSLFEQQVAKVLAKRKQLG